LDNYLKYFDYQYFIESWMEKSLSSIEVHYKPLEFKLCFIDRSYQFGGSSGLCFAEEELRDKLEESITD
jgi:hypothetical protein